MRKELLQDAGIKADKVPEDCLPCVSPDRNSAELEAYRRRLREERKPLRALSEHFSLLAGESRLKILALLECAGELCVCDLATVLEMTPAAVSQQLSRLRGGGLVVSRRQGMTIYYRRSDHQLLPRLCIPDLGPEEAEP